MNLNRIPVDVQTRRAGQPAAAVSQRASGFTLVELLVVMTLMLTLAGMLTLALSSAATDARVKRSGAETLTMGQLLQTRVNEIALSRLELSYGRDFSQPSLGGNSFPPVAVASLTPAANATERGRMLMLARRDLARMVMPCSREDLLMPPASLQFRSFVSRTYSDPNDPSVFNNVTGWVPNVSQVRPPAQWNRMRSLVGLASAAQADNYYQRATSTAISPTVNAEIDAIALFLSNRATGGSAPGPPTNEYFTAMTSSATSLVADASGNVNPVAVEWTREHESAECLYLILATTELFGQTAIDKLPTSAIANTDGDAVPEIVDPWGRPYEFFRNPAGLASGAIKNFRPGSANPYLVDPDPYDFLGTDFRYGLSGAYATASGKPDASVLPFYLPPAVVSAGPDGEFGLTRSYFEDDDGNLDGVNNSWSTSVVTWSDTALAPFYLNRYSPAVPGTFLAYRYPDPFYNVSSQAFSGAPSQSAYAASDTYPDYTIVSSGAGVLLGQVDLTREGGGLGSTNSATIGPVDRDAASDNISSLDVGF